MSGITRPLITLTLFLLVGLATVYFFIDRQVIFAENLGTETDQFQIIGKSTDLIDGWSISFCWRRANGPWMLYYLDHESPRWSNAKIRLYADKVVVLKDAKEIGYLYLRNGTFHLPVRDQIQRMPAKIVTAASPFDNLAHIYPGSQEWESVWPAAMMGISQH